MLDWSILLCVYDETFWQKINAALLYQNTLFKVTLKILSWWFFFKSYSGFTNVHPMPSLSQKEVFISTVFQL